MAETDRPVQEQTRTLLNRFATEHKELDEVLPLLRTAADQLALARTPRRHGAAPGRNAIERLVPHEEAEEAELLPAMARTRAAGRRSPHEPGTRRDRPLSTRRLTTHLDALDGGAELTPERRQDLLACLYGLHTLLQLHFLQRKKVTSPSPPTSRSTAPRRVRNRFMLRMSRPAPHVWTARLERGEDDQPASRSGTTDQARTVV